MVHHTLARRLPFRPKAILGALAARIANHFVARAPDDVPTTAGRWPGVVILLVILGGSTVLWAGIIATAIQVAPQIG